jgi:predicted RNA-binding protein YlqC (UPF0109 family)
MYHMSSIDQDFVEYVVKSLVSQPGKVQVERRIDEKGVLLELTVDPEDLGRVIGKRGATAQSLRTLLRALGTKNDARYNLKIIDNGVGGNRSGEESNYSEAPSPVMNNTALAGFAASKAADSDTSDSTTTEPTQESTKESTSNSDRLNQHRRELEEFDDLDI